MPCPTPTPQKIFAVEFTVDLRSSVTPVLGEDNVANDGIP